MYFWERGTCPLQHRVSRCISVSLPSLTSIFAPTPIWRSKLRELGHGRQRESLSLSILCRKRQTLSPLEFLTEPKRILWIWQDNCSNVNLITWPAASCAPPCCWWWCAWLWPSPWGWPPPHYPPPPLPSAYSASWQSLSSWCWFVIWATQPLFVESLWNQNWVYSLINHKVCCLILSLWQEGVSIKSDWWCVSEGTMLKFDIILQQTVPNLQIFNSYHIIHLARFRSNTSNQSKYQKLRWRIEVTATLYFMMSRWIWRSLNFFYDVQILSASSALIHDWECESFLNWKTNGLANFLSGPQHPGHPQWN